MNQDSSFPPMLPPSTELSALLFAVLPCLREPYKPLASFAYHITELTKLKSLSPVPPFSGSSGIESLISDKDAMLYSLSFYGKLFHMPLLSSIASLLQAMQFYHAYKDILPGLFSAMGNENASPSFDHMAGLFSGLGGNSSDLASSLGKLSPELLASLFSGNFSAESASPATQQASSATTPPVQEPPTEEVPAPPSKEPSSSDSSPEAAPAASQDLYDSLSALLTPEQKEIYELLMNTE